MFVKCAEKTELPGYGFFAPRETCILGRRKRLPPRKNRSRGIEGRRLAVYWHGAGCQNGNPGLYQASSAGSAGLWVLPMVPEPGSAVKPVPFLPTVSATMGQFSPDGRWVAYRSTESGRGEIYVVPFPGPGGKRQISTAGGVFPRWRADGKEIFFLSPGTRLMAAEVAVKGGALEVGAVHSLFGPLAFEFYPYEVSADGQHFLALRAPEEKGVTPLTLIQNWTGLLKK